MNTAMAPFKIELPCGEQHVVQPAFSMGWCKACDEVNIRAPMTCWIARDTSCLITDCLPDPSRTCKRAPPPPTFMDLPLVSWPSEHWESIRKFSLSERPDHKCEYCSLSQDCESLVPSCGSIRVVTSCDNPKQEYVLSRPCVGSDIIRKGLALSTEMCPVKNTGFYHPKPRYFQYRPIEASDISTFLQQRHQHTLRQLARVFGAFHSMPRQTKLQESSTFFGGLTKNATNPQVFHAFFKTYPGLQRLIGNYILCNLLKNQ